MTLQDLKKENPSKITIKQAAEIMNVTPLFLQIGLRNNRFPFGTAVKMSKEWSYYINTQRFVIYMEGQDMGREEIANIK